MVAQGAAGDRGLQGILQGRFQADPVAGAEKKKSAVICITNDFFNSNERGSKLGCRRGSIFSCHFEMNLGATNKWGKGG